MKRPTIAEREAAHRDRQARQKLEMRREAHLLVIVSLQQKQADMHGAITVLRDELNIIDKQLAVTP